VSDLRRNANLFATFLVSGFWHGANWTFIAWGALHGAYLVFGNETRQHRERIKRSLGIEPSARFNRIVQTLFTFALVCFAWIFFRARNLTEASHVATHLFTGIPRQVGLAISNVGGARDALVYLGQGKWVFGLAIFGILVLETIHMMQRHGRMRTMLAEKSAWVRWPVYYGLVLSILLLGVFNKTSFIYFQF
jgi:hypothetical protein